MILRVNFVSFIESRISSKWVLLISLLLGTNLYAILPLPYPLEPFDDNNDELAELNRDKKQVQGYADLFAGGQTREMELPHFENPSGTLGYSSETFTVPRELTERVQFWKRIYSEFTSSQAVLHDSEHPHIVYGVVDIGKFVLNRSTSYRKKMQFVSRLLKIEKAKAVEKLKQLHALQKDPSKIPVDLFPIFKEFETIHEPDKFLLAAKRIRTQIGQRDKIVQGFFYGGRYFTQMMEIFEKKKVPKELTRLPLVESAFNLSARSKVGASGVWQFMRGTGKRFLRIDKSVDERNDPIAATWAAAELLSQNYQALGDWSLAITAYNHGREGMLNAVRTVATTSLVEIIRKYKARNFGFASSNFYSEFLAILEVEREYRKYFGKLMVDGPIKYEEFHLGEDVALEELKSACRMKQQEVELLNPALTNWVLSGKGPVPRGFTFKVPPEKLEQCKSGYRNISSSTTRETKKNV